MTKEEITKILFSSAKEEFMAIVTALSDDDAIEAYRYLTEVATETPMYKNDAGDGDM